MSDDDDVIIEIGFSAKMNRRAAELYDEAFGQKLGLAVPDPKSRLRILERAMKAEFALAATKGGHLVGLAGFHTLEGSLTGGVGWAELAEELGTLSALRAAGVFALYERKPEPGQLLMDGICVAQEARGLGVGTRLLEALFELGRSRGFRSVRLDVIDVNPKARKLYERMGFQAVKTTSYPLIGRTLGFGASTEMTLEL